MGWNNTPTKNGFEYRPRLKVWRDGTNNEFNPSDFEARSYGHWLYCTKIKGKVVFNDYGYSTTTNYHQSHMRDLLKKLKIKIDVVVSTNASLSSLNRGLEEKYEALFSAEINAEHAKSRKDMYLESIELLKKDIKVLRELGAKFSKQDQKSLKVSMVNRANEKRSRQRQEAREKAQDRKHQLSMVKPELEDLSATDF